ncbi:MAG: CotH kinase family protein [Bacteroidales bacterium]|nr:CotH kinase family protein [Bacteroidales bacterium]
MKLRTSIISILILSFCALVNAQDIVINEVSYSNIGLLRDFDGDTPDWFEIYNRGSMPVNLYGYSVTDDSLETARWIFPDYIVEPGSYIRVFASGKDRKNTSELHTDFKLGLMKDPLFLFCPAGTIIDKIDATCVAANKTLGRKPDGAESFVVLAPSPGATNNHSEVFTVNYRPDSLTVNYKSGFYNHSVQLEFSNLNPQNRIVYTLNGDEPGAKAEEYKSAIALEDLTSSKNRFANIPKDQYKPGDQIFKANIVRAVVMSDGCPASNEICNTYFINKEIKGRYQVPVISIVTEGDNFFNDKTGIYVLGDDINYYKRGKKWERPADIEMFGPDGNSMFKQVAGVRIHGGGSRGLPQKSFRLYARPEYGNEYFNYPFFSQKPHLDKFKTLILHSSSDWSRSLFKDELCHALVSQMNIDNPATQTVIAFINGEYWGIYSLRERQDNYYIENNYGIQNASADIIAYKFENIEVEEGTIDEYNYLINEIENADKNSDCFFEEISHRIDIDALIDYFIVQLYLANTDFPHNNQELWKLRSDTSKWRYFLFDLDAMMFRDNYDHLKEYNNTIPEHQRFPWYSTTILRHLLQNEEFNKLFNARFNLHINSTFSASRVIDYINLYEKIYAPLVPEHAYRWHFPVNYTVWESNVSVLKKFAIQRPVEMVKQLHHNLENPFFIAPNPCNGNFSLIFSVPCGPVTVKIFDVNSILRGEWIFPNPEVVKADITTNLTNGFYLVQVQTGITIYTQQLIVQ